MHLFTLGASHHSAPIEFREKISFAPEQLLSAVDSIRRAQLAKGVVIVSTCNRTEFYLASDKKIAQDKLTEWVSNTQKISVAQLRENTYQHNESDVPRHLFRVASGLDSMALGEPQILGQLKDAYQHAIEANSVDPTLNQLFQQAFHVAKDVRTKTRLGDNSISMVHVATKLPNHFFGRFNKLTAMIIGAGETSQLATKNLINLGIKKFIFANRTLDNAQKLATQHHGYAINLSQITDHLHEADIIFAATASPNTLISRDMVENSLKKRKQSIQLFLDLSIPRNIDGTVTHLDNAYVYAVDDLKDIAEKNQSERETSAQTAEKLIESYHQDFLKKLALNRNTDLIHSVKASADADKDIALKYAMRQLNRGDDPKAVIEQLASSLSKRIAHHPIKLIREANDAQNDSMLDLIKQIYDGR